MSKIILKFIYLFLDFVWFGNGKLKYYYKTKTEI